jgi:hypothetical protein
LCPLEELTPAIVNALLSSLDRVKRKDDLALLPIERRAAGAPTRRRRRHPGSPQGGAFRARRHRWKHPIVSDMRAVTHVARPSRAHDRTLISATRLRSITWRATTLRQRENQVVNNQDLNTAEARFFRICLEGERRQIQ